MEEKVLSCEFNMDTGCVEVKYADGGMISINCTEENVSHGPLKEGAVSDS